MVIIQGHQKVNSMVKHVKIGFLTNTNSKGIVVRLIDIILTENSIPTTILLIKDHFQKAHLSISKSKI